ASSPTGSSRLWPRCWSGGARDPPPGLCRGPRGGAPAPRGGAPPPNPPPGRPRGRGGPPRGPAPPPRRPPHPGGRPPRRRPPPPWRTSGRDPRPEGAKHREALVARARAADAALAAAREGAQPAGDPDPYRPPAGAASDGDDDGGADEPAGPAGPDAAGGLSR